MTNLDSLESFAENFRQDVLAMAESDEQDMMLSDAFTQTAFDLISEAGESEDPIVCFHTATGMEVSGYLMDEEEARLDLFLSIHTNSSPPETVDRRRVERAFRRLQGFFEWCLSGKYVELEVSSPVFDMASHIQEFKSDLRRVRLFVLTDGRTTVEQSPKDRSVGDVSISSSLLDIVRLHRLSTSGRQRERISVDLTKQPREPIPCLQAESSQEGYRAFLMLIPGDLLRDIYAEFGPRLLETNVRSFLQARGKINRGIRDTISRAPERFLAYNNGITMTAESVDLRNIDGTMAVAGLDGLQIVNGGQTTASLLATERGKADLSQVHVATKLIEIQAGDVHDDLIRSVSRFANSQNRIAEADFSANDPFHVRIEELSRTVWAPAVGESQRLTRWFYERARGQYQDAKSSAGTPARRRAFSVEHPTRQRFTKTDLAKFENTWDQLPHVVSRGAQKNFSDYMIRLQKRNVTGIDQVYFERLIAKAILFRSTERIVQRQNFGGYRANIVTYTLALLSNATTQRIDLRRIWAEQALSVELENVIAELSHDVHEVITTPPSARNITEWCKSEKCWDSVRSTVTITPVERLRHELLDASYTKKERERSLSELSPEYVDNLKRVVEVNSGGWKILAEWGKETGALEPRQQQLAGRIARAMQRGTNIRASDAAAAVEILNRAAERGFSIESDASGA